MSAVKQIPGLKTFKLPEAHGYDVIYGLAKGKGQEIYLSVSNEFTPGLCANIYSFDPSTETFRKVIDFERETCYKPSARRLPHSKVHLSLQATRNGRIFAASHFTAPAPGQRDFEPIECFRRAFEGSYVVEYDSRTNRVVNYGCLLPGEGCRISALDDTREMFYLLSYPKNHLYQFHYPTRKLLDVGRVGQENSFGMEVDDSGNVFTTDDFGRFLKYSWAEGVLEELDCYVPLKPGRRRQGNYARRMTKGLDGRVYGAGNKGMRLFEFCPQEEQIRDFGMVFGHEAETGHAFPRIPPLKAIAQTDARTLLLVYGGDGIYADETQVPNLVKYDLVSGEVTDLGKFIDEDGMPAWIPQCALYCQEEDALYVGLQHAMGELRLWKILLPRLADRKAPRPLISVSTAYEQKVNSVPFGSSVQGANTLPYLQAGSVSMLELGWFGEGKIIPAGESAIADLCFAGNVLYGITTGRKSHLFRYSPYAHNRFVENYDVHVCDLGIVADFPTSGARILCHPKIEQLILLLKGETEIQSLLYDRAAERTAYRPHYHSIPHWEPFSFRSSPWIVSSSWDALDFSLTDLVFDHERNAVWSVSNSGELVYVQMLSAELSRTAVRALPGTCVAVGQGSIFLVNDQGEAILMDVLGCPTIRTSYPDAATTRFTCSVYSDSSSFVVLGTADGRVMIHDPIKGIWKGEVDVGAKIRALVAGQARVVYGFCGEDNGIGEPFALDLTSFHVRRLGILQVRSDPRFWVNHHCDCAAIGRYGEVYFGEADRISHLFVYSPPLNFDGE